MTIKSPRSATILLLAAAASLSTVVAGAQDSSKTAAAAVPVATIGKPAPQLTFEKWLSAPKGDTALKTTFGDGKVYVLDFTATWCAACPQTYPVMTKLEAKYGSKGLRVIYVMELWGAMMGGQSAEEELKTTAEYINEHKLNPVGLLGPAMNLMTSGYSGQSGSLPNVVVIDKQGIVKTFGGFDEDAVIQAVDSAVAGTKSKTP